MHTKLQCLKIFELKILILKSFLNLRFSNIVSKITLKFNEQMSLKYLFDFCRCCTSGTRRRRITKHCCCSSSTKSVARNRRQPRRFRDDFGVGIGRSVSLIITRSRLFFSRLQHTYDIKFRFRKKNTFIYRLNWHSFSTTFHSWFPKHSNPVSWYSSSFESRLVVASAKV